MTHRPRRSVLYMPGSNARALEKAKTLAADAVILDLEDSVAPDAKAEARNLVCDAVKAGGFGKREVVIRVNGLASPWGAEDMAAAAAARPDAILVPKVSSAEDLTTAAVLADGMPLWAMIETPLSILNLKEIGATAEASKLTCFIIGTNDLVKDSRMKAANNRLALVPSLSLAVMAARAFDISCVDGVYNDIKDEAGFAAECEQGVLLGHGRQDAGAPFADRNRQPHFLTFAGRGDLGEGRDRRFCFAGKCDQGRCHAERQDGRTLAPHHG